MGGIAQEVTKTVWGSSTRALEKARVNAASKTYSCPLTACFDAVIALTRETTSLEDDNKIRDERNSESAEEAEEETTLAKAETPLIPFEDAATSPEIIEDNTVTEKPVEQIKYFELFLKDSLKHHIVVIGIDGSVNTTEVGIFFEPVEDNAVKIEISSLSTLAKNKVAEIIFAEFDKKFSN